MVPPPELPLLEPEALPLLDPELPPPESEPAPLDPPVPPLDEPELPEDCPPSCPPETPEVPEDAPLQAAMLRDPTASKPDHRHTFITWHTGGATDSFPPPMTNVHRLTPALNSARTGPSIHGS